MKTSGTVACKNFNTHKADSNKLLLRGLGEGEYREDGKGERGREKGDVDEGREGRGWEG